jgi:NTE family protein
VRSQAASNHLNEELSQLLSQIGAMKALDEAGLLQGRVSFVSGASAGALIGGLYAAGLTPTEMAEKVLAYQRSDFWDAPGMGGILKGRAFEQLLRDALPVQVFEECSVPLGVTAYSVSGLTTKCIKNGDLASALRASCTFPVLFAPVWHKEGVLIDGGVYDTAGLWSVPDDQVYTR